MGEKMAQRKKRARQKEEIEELEEVEEKPSRRGKKKGRKAEPGRDSSVIYRDGEMPRLHGKGVAFRLAMAISVVLALILIIFGIVSSVLQSNSLDDQIDSGGVEAVRILARTDFDCWKVLHGTSAQGREREASGGTLKADMTDEEKARMDANRNRLVKLVGGESQILMAQISQAAGKKLEIVRTSSPKIKNFEFKQTKSHRVGDVTIAYGTCFLDKNVYNARLFRAPIEDAAGEQIGFADLVLSENEIDKSRFELLLIMLILIVVFIGVGIGVSFFMGKKIAVPVQKLIEDVSIVAGGDLEHHTVPRSQDEIGLLARTFDKMTKNMAEARDREVELAAQKHQLAVAQEVQDKLLPEVIPQVKGYEIQAYHRSSKDMGGNYYDVIQFPGGKVGALVASASGKGIPAAMVMTMARSFMRAQTHMGDDLSGMVRECNRLLSPDLRAGMYVEILMVLIDAEKHVARIVSAGPTMLLRYDGPNKKLMAIQADGIAMGFDKGPVFDKSLKEAEVEFQPGDRLVLATEGLFKIKAPDGSELGTKGFAKCVIKHAAGDSTGFVRKVVNNLDSFAGGEVKASNITFVTIKRGE